VPVCSLVNTIQTRPLHFSNQATSDGNRPAPEFPRDTGKRPQYFGHLTNDIIYARLAPGVLEELRRVVPKRETGRGRKYPFTRRLTEEIGHPKLREHLASVTTIMRLSEQYDDFEVKLDRIHPRYDETLQLPFFDEEAAN
jgi:hypothetical protein